MKRKFAEDGGAPPAKRQRGPEEVLEENVRLRAALEAAHLEIHRLRGLTAALDRHLHDIVGTIEERLRLRVDGIRSCTPLVPWVPA